MNSIDCKTRLYKEQGTGVFLATSAAAAASGAAAAKRYFSGVGRVSSANPHRVG